MEFAAAAEKYDRFMGRYTASLAPRFADAAGVRAGMRVLDVGCGPGGLATELAARVGAEQVAAIDPAPQFAAACAERIPGADVRVGPAEALPWDDAAFDATLASLVIGFMADPEQGVREMVRVTRPGGTVAACMWDVDGGGMEMLRTFWTAAQAIDPHTPGERGRPGTAQGDIARRLEAAGLTEVEEVAVEARVDYVDFEDLWEPFTYGVGPVGQYLVSRTPEQRAAIRDRCRAAVPDGPFTLTARAWSGRGTVN